MKTDLKGKPLKNIELKNTETPCQGGRQDPWQGGRQDPWQQEKEKEKEKEKLTTTIIEKEDFLKDKYLANYKLYCNQILNDSMTIENINRIHKISMNLEICKGTIKKYLHLFLNQLSLSEDKHENKGKFTSHFSNWLRKQNINTVIIEKKTLRYG